MSKKEVEDLKAKIYKQVELLEDETALHLLEEAAVAYTTTSKDIVDELSVEQQLRLKESIQQAKEGNTISNDEVQKKAKQWLSK